MTDAELLSTITALGGENPKRDSDIESGMQSLAFGLHNTIRRFGVTGAGSSANEALLMAAEHGCFSVRIPANTFRDADPR